MQEINEQFFGNWAKEHGRICECEERRENKMNGQKIVMGRCIWDIKGSRVWKKVK